MEAREPTSEEITDYAYHLAHLVCAITEPGQNECSYPAYAIVNPDGEEEGDGWGICTYHFAEFPDHLWEGNDVVKIPAGRLAKNLKEAATRFMKAKTKDVPEDTSVLDDNTRSAICNLVDYIAFATNEEKDWAKKPQDDHIILDVVVTAGWLDPGHTAEEYLREIGKTWDVSAEDTERCVAALKNRRAYLDNSDK